MNDFKARLNNAFKAMRKAGIIARQNFSCCSNCAGCELAYHVTSMSAVRREKVRGCAFYTRQEAVHFNDRNFTGLYISFGSFDTEEHGQVGLDAVAVGQIVVNCLVQAGIAVEWDGTAKKMIYVKVT